MNFFDVIIVLVLIIALIRGYRHGLIVEVLGIASIFIAGYVAYYFSGAVAEWFTWDFSLKRELFFVIVFIAVMLGVGFVAKMLNRLFQAAGLGVMDGIGGSFIALCKYLIIMAVCLTILLSLNSQTGLISQKYIDSSSLIKPVTKISDYLFPYLGEAKKGIDKFKDEFFN